MTSLIDSKATKNLSGVKSGFKTRSMHNLAPCQKVLLQTKQYKNTELRETFSRAHLTHGQKALTLGSCVALSRPSQVEAALRQDSKVWVLSGPTALATSLWVCCLRKHALPLLVEKCLQHCRSAAVPDHFHGLLQEPSVGVSGRSLPSSLHVFRRGGIDGNDNTRDHWSSPQLSRTNRKACNDQSHGPQSL